MRVGLHSPLAAGLACGVKEYAKVSVCNHLFISGAAFTLYICCCSRISYWMWSCFGEEEEGMKILDPQGPFLVKWNKFMLLLCLLAVYVDALFLFIPVMNNDDKKCLGRDKRLEIATIVLRSFIDMFYIVHIVFRFRTGVIAPSSWNRSLCTDGWTIAKVYLSSTLFFVDFFAVLPLPQVLVLAVRMSLNTTKVLKYAIFVQYFPRLIRIYPFYKEVIISSGILTRSAWTGPALNLFLYMLAGHVIGAFWYLLSIERGTICWSQACGNQTQFNQKQCVNSWVHCDDDDDNNIGFKDFLNVSCPIETPNPKLFDYGIFIDSLQSGALGSINFLKKSSYCFWWGLQNLSSLGQNLKTSTDQQEVYFAVFISISGLVLFSFLIGNMQTFLQSTAQRLEKVRVKQRGVEQWMSSCLLPEDLRERVRRYQHYKWKETKGVDGEAIISDLPRDLRLDIKRHRYLNLLMRVPMFEKMDKLLLDALCDCLKPVLYTEASFILREGDRVHEMFFIMRGILSTVTTYGGRTGFFNSVYLKTGDFCGEELFFWALDPKSSTANPPISTRTVQTLSEVECFTLMPNDLKFVASQFSELDRWKLRHTFRFYSQQWRTWAACFIQAAWRLHCRKKLEKSLREEKDRLRDALARQGGGSSSSLGATINASRFAANALKALRSNVAQRAMVPEKYYSSSCTGEASRV